MDKIFPKNEEQRKECRSGSVSVDDFASNVSCKNGSENSDDLFFLSRFADFFGDSFAGQLLRFLAAIPEILSLLREQSNQIEALKSEMKSLLAQNCVGDPCGWLTSAKAKKYLDMTDDTFDKYHYKTTPHINACRLDGKNYFKREDLDTFMRLYDLKSRGLA